MAASIGQGQQGPLQHTFGVGGNGQSWPSGGVSAMEDYNALLAAGRPYRPGVAGGPLSDLWDPPPPPSSPTPTPTANPHPNNGQPYPSSGSGPHVGPIPSPTGNPNPYPTPSPTANPYPGGSPASSPIPSPTANPWGGQSPPTPQQATPPNQIPSLPQHEPWAGPLPLTPIPQQAVPPNQNTYNGPIRQPTWPGPLNLHQNALHRALGSSRRREDWGSNAD